MGYSSIVQKKCKCGCDNFPTISYEGYYMPHAPQEVLERLGKKQKRKKAVTKATSKLRNTEFKNGNYNEASTQALKMDLDHCFQRVVKITAADAETGFVSCYTCSNFGHWSLPFFQCGHFISRKVMLLRWDFRNARVQCKTCNEINSGNMNVYTERLEEEYKGLPEQLREMSVEPHKWGVSELKELLINLRAKLRIIEQKFQINKTEL